MTIMQEKMASSVVQLAPAVGGATWSLLDLPWGTYAAISTIIYASVMIVFGIYDRVKGRGKE